MQIDVELFGDLRGLSKNGAKFELEVDESMTIGGLLAEIGVQDKDSWSAAINGEVAYADSPLVASAKVIIFPPIAGG